MEKSIIRYKDGSIKYYSLNDNLGTDVIEDRKNVESIELEDSITRISSNAIALCFNAKNINLPKNLKHIDSWSFFACKNIEHIELQQSLHNIDFGAFAYCSKLKSLGIPSGVKHISNGAFYMCSNLKEIYYDGTIEQWKEIAANKWDDGSYIRVVHCNDGDINV